jgi:glycosyltransferase involved in cell wall biosynthesis
MSGNFLDTVTAVVLTYNEAPNIGRTLSKLEELRRIVVVDSGSDDGTQAIVTRHRNAEVVARPFDNFANQCNFALGQTGLDTEWVLSLDADYVLTDALVEEMRGLSPREDVVGYRARFRYCIFGRPIRCGVYPPVIALFRRQGARYVQDGHAHRVVVDGRIGELSVRIDHDDRKPFSRWVESQRSYASHEADQLARSDRAALRPQDRIRVLIGIAPPLMFLYVFLVRGGFLDGWQGLYYALQRAYAELLLSLELLDRKLRSLDDG